MVRQLAYMYIVHGVTSFTPVLYIAHLVRTIGEDLAQALSIPDRVPPVSPR